MKEGAVRIVRLDDARTAGQYPNKSYFERYVYGKVDDIALGAMILLEHLKGGGMWVLHVQETRTKPTGPALQTYMEGQKKSYELKLA